MANNLVPFHYLISLLVVLLLSSSPSNGLPIKPSKRSPRFLGRFSKPNKHLHKDLQKYKYETRYFDQNLDHYSFADLPKFRQRYLISFEHWVGPDKAGPIFFYCGNEGYIDWFAENTGFVWELSPRFGALVIFPEVKLRTPGRQILLIHSDCILSVGLSWWLLPKSYTTPSQFCYPVCGNMFNMHLKCVQKVKWTREMGRR